MKFLITLLIVIVLAGAGTAWWYSHAQTANADPLSQLTTGKVERGDLRLSIPANGVVASNKDVDIKVRASGEIIKLPVDISMDVEKDQVVMELDTKDQKPALEQAQAQVKSDEARVASAELNAKLAQLTLETNRVRANANLSSAKARAADAKSKAERTQQLFDKQLASREDMETSQTAAVQAEAEVLTAQASISELKQQETTVEIRKQDIQTANAALVQDKARLDLQQQAMDYCIVKSPISGTVSDLKVQIGNIVQSSISNVSGGTAVMTISDLSHVFVLASVDESDVGSVRLHEPVRVSSDSFPGVEFTGEVVRIATKGVNTSNVVTFEVKIEVTSPNKRLLRPVMTTQVEIVANERLDVLTIPMQAFNRKKVEQPQDAGSDATPTTAPAAQVSEGDAANAGMAAGGGGRRGGRNNGRPQQGTVVVVKADGTQETRDVTVGMNDRAFYEVISGLSEGETVLINKSTESKWSGGQGGQGGQGGRGGRGGAGQMMRGLGGR
jgi:HlyD family secretion protein